MTAPAMANKPVYLSFDADVFDGLSDKLKETIGQSPEFQQVNGKAIDAAVAAAGASPFDDEMRKMPDGRSLRTWGHPCPCGLP